MRSKILFIANVLASVYTIYLIIHFVGGTINAEGAVEAIAGAIATVLVAPHIFIFLVGAIFGWVCFFSRKCWAALVAAILYSVGTLIFLLNAIYGVPILIFGFIGYSKQKKLNSQYYKSSAEESESE